MYTTMRWWRLAGCEPSYAGAGCGTSPRVARGYAMEMRGHGHGHGSGRGVRRPLRFLAWKLELDEDQLGEVAKILSELKTEDAQGEVDTREAARRVRGCRVGGGVRRGARGRGRGDARRERGADAQRVAEGARAAARAARRGAAAHARVSDPHRKHLVLALSC